MTIDKKHSHINISRATGCLLGLLGYKWPWDIEITVVVRYRDRPVEDHTQVSSSLVKPWRKSVNGVHNSLTYTDMNILAPVEIDRVESATDM